MPDNEPVGNITQFTQREQGGQQKIKQRPMAALFFSYQTPRALTIILRAQPQEGKQYNAAAVRLARTRLNVLFTMVIKADTFYSKEYASTPYPLSTPPAPQHRRLAPPTPADYSACPTIGAKSPSHLPVDLTNTIGSPPFLVLKPAIFRANTLLSINPKNKPPGFKT